MARNRLALSLNRDLVQFVKLLGAANRITVALPMLNR